MLFKVECQQCGKQERISTVRLGELPGGWSNEAVVNTGLEPLTLCDLCTADWKVCAEAAIALFNSKQGEAITRLAALTK